MGKQYHINKINHVSYLSEDGPIIRKPTGVVLLSSVLALAAFLATLNQMHDWDAFYHLAYGRDILRRGGFSGEDPFLFTLAGLPSGPLPSWLGSIVIYLSWILLGDGGPLFLVSVVSAVVFVLIVVDSLEGESKWLDVITALALIGIALAVYRGRATPRPEMFANLLIAVTLYALRRHLTGKSRTLLAFTLLVALWTNLHHSVLAGVAVMGIFAGVNALFLLGGRLTECLRETSNWRCVLLPFLVTAMGVLFAGIISPVGFQAFVYPIRIVLLWVGVTSSPLMGSGPSISGDPDFLLKGSITELQPMVLGLLDPFTWLLIATAASFAVPGIVHRRLNVRELLTCLAFGLLAVRAVRFGAMASIVLTPIAVRNFRAGLRPASYRIRRALAWSLPLAALVILTTIWTVTLSRSSLRFGTGPAIALPARAVDYLRAAGVSVRLFNTFHFGGYLEWMLDGKVYQDGRGQLRPDEAHAAVLGPFSRETFAALDARYRFDALVIEYPEITPDLVAMLTATVPDDDWAADRRKWSLVAFDDGGMLYLRRDGALAHRALRDEYRFARPAVPPGVGNRDSLAARIEFERSLQEAPRCTVCRNALGYLYLREGRTSEAEGMFADALNGPHSVRVQVLFGYAQSALLRGDLNAAESRLREVIKVAADPSGLRRQLAMLLAEQGRPREALLEIEKNMRNAPQETEDLKLALDFARNAGDLRKVHELERKLP